MLQRSSDHQVTIQPVLGDFVKNVDADFGEGPYALGGRRHHVRLSPEDLSTHVLFLGTTGSGKTNAIRHLLRAVRAEMSSDDVMVIFDTKGDYLREFYNPGKDVVLAHRKLENHGPLRGTVLYEHWNLLGEILADDPEFRKETIAEVTRTMFDDAVQESKDPFFPRAAQEVTAAVMDGMLRGPDAHPTNADLLRNLRDYDETMEILRHYPDLTYAEWFIKDRDRQAQGVVSTMHLTLAELFTGQFALPGDFSIRDFVRKRGGGTVFLEYDIRSGRVLSPIFRMLFDLAIKESLSREKPKGNVYFVIDEFGLLPRLQHVDDGISFGRELGVKFVVGSQNVNQVVEAYGKERAASILSNFGTLFAFRLNDKESRDLVTNRFGEFCRRIDLPSDPCPRIAVPTDYDRAGHRGHTHLDARSPQLHRMPTCMGPASLRVRVRPYAHVDLRRPSDADVQLDRGGLPHGVVRLVLGRWPLGRQRRGLRRGRGIRITVGWGRASGGCLRNGLPERARGGVTRRY